MSLHTRIETLRRLCFLAHEGDSIEQVEDMLNELAHAADNNLLVDLCSVFHDEIDETSIIGDLIETIFYIIERNGMEDGLYKVIEGVSLVLLQDNYCVIRLYRSVLASKDLIMVLEKKGNLCKRKKERITQFGIATGSMHLG